jgi:hypothetical protein
MRYFNSLAKLLPWGLRKLHEQELVLAGAYQRVFHGNPSQRDQEIVLLDLADFSGFYRVTVPGAEDLAFREGMRAMYGRIFRYIRMTNDEIRSLEEAVRATRIAVAELADGREQE